MQTDVFEGPIRTSCYVIESRQSFSVSPPASSAVSLCSFSELSSVCGVSSAFSSLSGGEFCSANGLGPGKFVLMSIVSKIVVVISESLKIVSEKTELKVNDKPRGGSCKTDLWCFVGTITAGSLGGLTGGTGPGSLFLTSEFRSCACSCCSVWTVPLQSLLTLERRDEPSAEEITLLARGRLLGDLNSPSCASFTRGAEKQFRQPDIEDDLPWT